MKKISDFVRKEENIWTNFEFDPNKAYILYSGNNDFSSFTEKLIPLLSKRYNKPTEVIKISNRIHSSDEKLLVTHPSLDEMMEDKETNKWFWYPVEQMSNLFQSNYFQNLSENILKNQRELFLDLFTNNKIPTDLLNPQIKVLAPPKQIVEKLYDKFNMYNFLESKGFPMPTGYQVKGRNQVMQAFISDFKEGIYVTKRKSSAGEGCRIFTKLEDISNSHFLSEDEDYFVKKKIEVAKSPTISGCIADNRIEVFYLVDQILKEGTNILGVEYPSKLNPKTQNEIFEITYEIGKALREENFNGIPYRSFYNVDFIITPNEKIYVAEINPRKFGSLGEYVETNEYVKEKNQISIPEMGFLSLEEGNLPHVDFDNKPENFYWARRAIKVPGNFTTKKDINDYYESIKEALRNKGTAFINYLGKNTKFYSEEPCVLGCLFTSSDKYFDGSLHLSQHEEKIKKQLNIK